MKYSFLFFVALFLINNAFAQITSIAEYSFNGTTENSITLEIGEINGSIQFDEGILDQAIHFQGNGFVNLGELYTINSQDFSTSMWIKFDDHDSDNQFFTNDSLSDPDPNFFALTYANNNTKKIRLVTYDHDQIANNLYTVGDYEIDNWYYLSVVRSGDMGFIYIDGVLENSGTINGGDIGDIKDWILGKGHQGGFFRGSIDELQVFDLALSSEQVDSLYNEKSQVDTLIAFYPFNGNADDESGNGNDAIAVNAIPALDRFGVMNSAYEFDGIDDFIEIPGSFSDNQVQGSVSLWVQFDDELDDYNVLAKGPNDFRIQYSQAIDDIYFSLNSETAADRDYTDANLDWKDWNHIIITWNETTKAVYLNGELDYQISNSLPISNDIGNVYLGRNGGIGTNDYEFLKGKIDDIRWYNYVVDENEISSLYNENGWPFTDKYVIVHDNISYSVSGNSTEIELRNIDESDSISAYQFDLEIPDGITFIGLDTTATLTSGGSFQTNVIDDTLKVAFFTTEYLVRDSLLVKLQFDADGSGDYEIVPFNFVLNNMDIDSVTPGILSVVELLGDVDDNDSIQAYDGALALQYSVDIDPIPAIDALPWDIWRVAAADVDRDGSVLALDASYILQKTVDLIDGFPNEALKSLPIELIIQQDGSQLVFATPSEGLIGFNASIPTSDALVFSEPVYSWSESIHAINQKENSLEIGIASHIPASGEFMRIPFAITEEQSFEIEVNKNNVSQVIAITLSSEGVQAELVSEKVRSFDLSQNYPNPFNPSTNINFSIPQSQHVTLKVYDISGREIATLVDGIQNIGEHTINFEASNLASGVYIYRLTAGSLVETKRMLLIK